jgi:hypothetical protein
MELSLEYIYILRCAVLSPVHGSALEATQGKVLIQRDCLV